MPGRRFTDEQRDQMAERREAGETVAAIAVAFGCSTSMVYWTCLALGAEKPGAKPLPTAVRGPMVMQRNGYAVRRYTPEEDARLIALEAEGLGDTEIGKAMGRRPNSIRGRLMALARRQARSEAA